MDQAAAWTVPVVKATGIFIYIPSFHYNHLTFHHQRWSLFISDIFFFKHEKKIYFCDGSVCGLGRTGGDDYRLFHFI